MAAISASPASERLPPWLIIVKVEMAITGTSFGGMASRLSEVKLGGHGVGGWVGESAVGGAGWPVGARGGGLAALASHRLCPSPHSPHPTV